jgi:hypothetical protein
MTSLRETISAAFDAPSDEPDAPAVDVSVEAAEPTAPVETKGERTRDEGGKFSKPPAAEKAPADVAPAKTLKPVDADAATEATPPPALKAPQSWKPQVREEWGKLPRPVQEEISRVNAEIQATMAQSAQARRVAGEFEAQVSPFAGIIRAQGQDPMKLTGELMRTYSALATGSQSHKAAVLAGLVKSFGVDIQALDSALSGATPAHPSGEMRDPRFDQLMAHLQSQAASRGESVMQQAAADVEAFAAKAEFLDDVREDAAALLRAGVAKDLEDAYTRACWANPSIRAILQQRDSVKTAETARAATQKAKAAGSSIKSSPSGGVGETSKAKSLRDTIEGAWESTSGR